MVLNNEKATLQVPGIGWRVPGVSGALSRALRGCFLCLALQSTKTEMPVGILVQAARSRALVLIGTTVHSSLRLPLKAV